MPYTPTYDDNGSLTSDGVWTFTYNVENQLTRAEKTGIDANYEYDPYGRRSKKSGTGVVTEVYLTNGSNEIADYDGSGTVLRRYIHGPGIDEPVAMTTGTGFTTISYYHADYLGSIVAMSDNTGALSEQYRYSPYGEVDDTTGNPFRYTGRRLDAETGLYYYRARYYSATLGRFLQVDPIGYGDGLNTQAYVGNDPINASDPSGTRGIIKRYETIYYLSDDGSGGAGGSSGGAGTPCPECENVTVTGNRIKPIKYSGVSASFRLAALGGFGGNSRGGSWGRGGSNDDSDMCAGENSGALTALDPAQSLLEGGTIAKDGPDSKSAKNAGKAGTALTIWNEFMEAQSEVQNGVSIPNAGANFTVETGLTLFGGALGGGLAVELIAGTACAASGWCLAAVAIGGAAVGGSLLGSIEGKMGQDQLKPDCKPKD